MQGKIDTILSSSYHQYSIFNQMAKSIHLDSDTCLYIPKLSSSYDDDLDLAKTIIAKALDIEENVFECRDSSFLNGTYYRYEDIEIISNDPDGDPGYDQPEGSEDYSVICETDNLETSNKIINYYNKVYKLY